MPGNKYKAEHRQVPYQALSDGRCIVMPLTAYSCSFKYVDSSVKAFLFLFQIVQVQVRSYIQVSVAIVELLLFSNQLRRQG